MASILVLNGPNLNLLGTREPEIYGSETLDTIRDRLTLMGNEAGHSVKFVQSNAEHELVAELHRARDAGTDFLIINPAAFTHTSVALRDAILGIAIPFIEVHITNIYTREEFRQNSYFSDIALGVISGLGAQGYELALQAAIAHIDR